MERGAPVTRAVRALGAAAALLLAACRSDGERGHAFTPASTLQPQSIASWRLQVPRAAARVGTSAERDETARLAALARSILETEREAGSAALARVSSAPLRAHAAMAEAAAERGLEALRTLAVARGLEVATAALEDDPVMVAQRDASARELASLRALTAEAFAGVWLASEVSRLELLGSLAVLAVRLSPDVATGNVFGMIAHDARTRTEGAVTLHTAGRLSRTASSVKRF